MFIVTDTGWVRHTVKAVRFLIPSEVRVFSRIEAEEGRTWITALPGADADVKWPRRLEPGCHGRSGCGHRPQSIGGAPCARSSAETPRHLRRTPVERAALS